MNKNNRRNTSSYKHNNRGGQNRKQQKSTLDPQRLVQEAQLSFEKKFQASMRFSEMNIDNRIKKNIAMMGFESPTEIQEKSYKELVSGRNMIGIANTGTGKTGAFLIPIIERMLAKPTAKEQALVILPTRELAVQVQDEFNKLTRDIALRSASFIGGTNIKSDLNKLQKHNDLIVGTPGRLLDLINRGNLNIRSTEILILDEFDRMLDMGFVKDIRSIVKCMKNRKQTMLFSATLNRGQQSIINEMVHQPIKIEVSKGDSASKNVNQDIINVPTGDNKYDHLLKLLKSSGFDKVILFAETKRLVDKLSKKLNKSGIKSDQIHGNKSQNYRLKALSKFKNGSVKILVATDVAARGVDIENVSHVINYQLPRDFDTYIHRIGRTGRAGKTGTAYTFVD